MQGRFRGTAVDLREGVLQQLDGGQDLKETEKGTSGTNTPPARSLEFQRAAVTCGKRGLSSLDFLMQSATNLFMALGQFL